MCATPYEPLIRCLYWSWCIWNQPINVEQLAIEAGVSTFVFPRSFKTVTASSPIQYLKKIQLNRAKTLILYEGIKTSVATTRVGYGSAS